MVSYFFSKVQRPEHRSDNSALTIFEQLTLPAINRLFHLALSEEKSATQPGSILPSVVLEIL